MEAPATIGDFFQTLYEMGFNETQVQAAVRAGVFSVQEAAEWLLRGGEQRQPLQTNSSEQSGVGAIAAFNPPRLQELPSSPGTSATDSSSQESLGSPSTWQVEVSSPSSRMKIDKKEFEEQQRDKLAQEVKAEKRNKKKDHEMVLKRIADDRKTLQEKMQVTPKPDASPQKGQRLGGKVQTAADNYCLLMIRLPSGDSIRDRFSADSPLQKVVEHISRLHPELPNFDLLQTFPKRHFSEAEMSSTLQALGLTPNATLCIRASEKKPPEASNELLSNKPPLDSQNEETKEIVRSSGLLDPRPQALPMEDHYSWGRGASLAVGAEDMTPEALMREGNDLLPLLSSPAHRVTPGNPGVHGLWLPPFSRNHRWGRGQKLVPEEEEEVAEGQEPAEEDGEEQQHVVIPGFGRGLLPPGNRAVDPQEHLWPSEGNRLRAGGHEAGPAGAGNPSPPEDLPAAMAQAAAQRLHHTFREQQSCLQLPTKKTYRLSQVPSLFQLAIRAAVTLMTAPSMQYCSSLASLTPELAEHLIAHMIREKLLRPKTLELFFGCQIQKIVLNCYPYATNELLRQLRAFHTLKHLSLVSCSLITDQGLSVVNQLQKLQHLNLCACVKLTDSCLHSLKGLEHLSHLFLDQTKVSDPGMIDYLESAPPCLTQLSLNRTAITEKTLSVLPQRVPHLRTLSIMQTQVIDLSALQELKCLHTLHIDNTNISENSLLALAAHPAISTLSLSGIQSVDGNRVLQLISGLNLVHLVLPSRHTVTDIGLSFLCHLQGLLQLDLTDYSHITDEGVKYLAQLKRLKKLSLCNTPLTDAGLPHLQSLKDLEDLCLDRTNVTSVGVSKCIPSLSHLQVLGLACTPVGDNVLRLGVRCCKQLLKVNLSRTRITDRGLQYLRKMKICQVNLDGTGVTSTGVANLVSACPSLISIRASNLKVIPSDQVSDEELPG